MQKAKSAPLDRETLARRLYLIGRGQLELDRLEADMNAEIDRVKRRYAHRLELRRSGIEEAARILRLACEDSRQSLLTGRRKSVDTIFGRVGWRTQGDKVVLAKGVKGEAAAQALLDAGHETLARQRPEIDKPAVKAAIANGTMPLPDLARFGIRLVAAGEDWYYEVDRESVAEHLGEEAA